MQLAREYLGKLIVIKTVQLIKIYNHREQIRKETEGGRVFNYGVRRSNRSSIIVAITICI
jgi:hypothetical protein